MIINDMPCLILSQYIIDSGYMSLPSLNSDWPIYTTYLPDGNNVNDNTGAAYDTTPLIDGRLMNSDFIQHYGVQLKIRCKSFNDGWDKINEIAISMDSVHNVSQAVNGTNYLIQNISRSSGPTFIGIEKGTKRRNLFSVNFLVTLKEI